MWNYYYIFNLLYCIANAMQFNTYTRCPATSEEISEFEAQNTADVCLVDIEPCGENEWRRIDGSCNNLKYPSYGTIHTPEWRMLPANYGEGYTPRKMVSGEDYPLARLIRLYLLRVGDGIDQKFAASATYFLEYITTDIISAHDTEEYLLKKTYCCEPEGLTDPMCVPNYIPENDNVHRFSNHKCINMTVPKFFQNQGCAPADTLPSRTNLATPHIDLSSIYYFNGNASAARDTRTYEGGKLKVEVVNGISLPSDATNSTTCFIQQARETGCTRYVPNVLPGTNIVTTWFWRFHNFIADELAKLNPCWGDDLLMNVAKDINIAYQNQLMFYELFAEVLGKDNLIKEGILHSDEGFRDPYDEEVMPAMSMEFLYALRWFHTTQDGQQEMYDENDHFIGTTPMANFSLAVHELAYDKNLERLTRGLYLQHAGSFGDNTVHPDMADLALGPLQQIIDITTNDLAKGRYFGLPPYIQYRDYCTNYTVKHETFEQLKDVMDDDKIEELAKMYGDILNIEVMAGMWSERLMEGTSVPPTVHCMMVKQLYRTIISDSYWYERPNRRHAFTEAQLKQIRQATFAALLCAVGDNVTEIQPKAFLRIGPGNEKVSCEEIPRLDVTPWKDDSCST